MQIFKEKEKLILVIEVRWHITDCSHKTKYYLRGSMSQPWPKNFQDSTPRLHLQLRPETQSWFFPRSKSNSQVPHLVKAVPFTETKEMHKSDTP